MKRSAFVTTGLVLAAAISFACASDGEEFVNADNQEICLDRETGDRVDDSNCPESGGSSRYHHWYHGSAHGPAPAVGSKINPAHGTSVRPGGSISRPPASGGFGGSRVSSGS